MIGFRVRSLLLHGIRKMLASSRIKSPINVAGWILAKLVPVFAFL